jgi:hypothetical protein
MKKLLAGALLIALTIMAHSAKASCTGNCEEYAIGYSIPNWGTTPVQVISFFTWIPNGVVGYPAVWQIGFYGGCDAPFVEISYDGGPHWTVVGYNASGAKIATLYTAPGHNVGVQIYGDEFGSGYFYVNLQDYTASHHAFGSAFVNLPLDCNGADVYASTQINACNELAGNITFSSWEMNLCDNPECNDGQPGPLDVGQSLNGAQFFYVAGTGDLGSCGMNGYASSNGDYISLNP